jgi:hypothetical protein
MPSKSEKQQKFFGAVMGAKKGQKGVSGAAKKVAKDMPKKEIKKFLKKENEEDSESVAKKIKKTGKAEFTVKKPKDRKKTAPPTQVQKSKKGKGSYSRKKKDDETLTESTILNFIDCILEKKYDDASKYLTSILNSKLQARIEKELDTPLF